MSCIEKAFYDDAVLVLSYHPGAVFDSMAGKNHVTRMNPSRFLHCNGHLMNWE